jgi:hypothetical protein
VIFTFEGVIKSLKNWLKMAKNSSDLSKNRGENAIFGSAWGWFFPREEATGRDRSWHG